MFNRRNKQTEAPHPAADPRRPELARDYEPPKRTDEETKRRKAFIAAEMAKINAAFVKPKPLDIREMDEGEEKAALREKLGVTLAEQVKASHETPAVLSQDAFVALDNLRRAREAASGHEA